MYLSSSFVSEINTPIAVLVRHGDAVALAKLSPPAMTTQFSSPLHIVGVCDHTHDVARNVDLAVELNLDVLKGGFAVHVAGLSSLLLPLPFLRLPRCSSAHLHEALDVIRSSISALVSLNSIDLIEQDVAAVRQRAELCVLVV